MPRGATPAIGYSLVQVLAAAKRNRAIIFAATAACTVLTWSGYFLEPAGGLRWTSAFERSMVTMVLWLTLLLIVRRLSLIAAPAERSEALEKTSRELMRSNAELESFASVVRRFPGSRRLPQFNAEHLAAELPKHGLSYVPCPLLGGRRKPDPDSINVGWRNKSFRAYADYMQMPPFLKGLDLLMRAARRLPSAMMCAEAVPWRCHRSLIADALIVRGWTVLDVMTAAKATPHKLTPFSLVRGSRITYPSEQAGSAADASSGAGTGGSDE